MNAILARVVVVERFFMSNFFLISFKISVLQYGGYWKNKVPRPDQKLVLQMAQHSKITLLSSKIDNNLETNKIFMDDRNQNGC